MPPIHPRRIPPKHPRHPEFVPGSRTIVTIWGRSMAASVVANRPGGVIVDIPDGKGRTTRRFVRHADIG